MMMNTIVQKIKIQVNGWRVCVLGGGRVWGAVKALDDKLRRDHSKNEFNTLIGFHLFFVN